MWRSFFLMTRAFTLIESLLALTLAGMLMVAMLAVKESLSVSQRAFARVDRTANVRWERIRNVLYWDLVHATRVSGGTSIETMAYMDPISRTPHLRPVLVSYKTKRTDKALWLVRRQREVGNSSQTREWEDLLASGIRRIEITTLAQDATESEDARIGPPNQVRVVLVPELGTPQEFTLTLR
jgi:hypothetical protein